MTEQKKSQLYKNLATAGVASVIARTTVCPLERVEILRQIDNSEFKSINLVKSLKKLYEVQGIKGLFKGNIASLLRIFPFSSIEFYSMELFKNLFIRGQEHEFSKSQMFQRLMLCGTLTGLSAISLTYPLDVIRTRMASNFTDSNHKQTKFFSSFADLYKLSGIRGLYKGYFITFFGSVPYVAIKQTTYEGLKALYKSKKYHSLVNFGYGSFAGLFGTILLYPSYMLKRVLQANSMYIYNYILYKVIIILEYSHTLGKYSLPKEFKVFIRDYP
jgi:hypothetical protein